MVKLRAKSKYIFLECYHGKRLRKPKQDTPGPTGRRQVFGGCTVRGKRGVKPGRKSSTVLIEPRALLSTGMKLP